MTIHVQQDVLVTLSSSSHHAWPISDQEDEFLLFRKKSSYGYDDMGKEIESDDDSVLTLSTASLSDIESDSSVSMLRVSFAEELVSVEWTRPYTATEDLGDLYYSTEETNRYVRSFYRRFVLGREFYVNVCRWAG